MDESHLAILAHSLYCCIESNPIVTHKYKKTDVQSSKIYPNRVVHEENDDVLNDLIHHPPE